MPVLVAAVLKETPLLLLQHLDLDTEQRAVRLNARRLDKIVVLRATLSEAVRILTTMLNKIWRCDLKCTQGSPDLISN